MTRPEAQQIVDTVTFQVPQPMSLNFLDAVGRKYRVGWSSDDFTELERRIVRFFQEIDHLPRDYQVSLLVMFVRATFRLDGADVAILRLAEKFGGYLDSLPTMD